MAFCDQCGSDTSSAHKFCRSCGARLPERAVPAPARAQPSPTQDPPTEPMPWISAGYAAPGPAAEAPTIPVRPPAVPAPAAPARASAAPAPAPARPEAAWQEPSPVAEPEGPTGLAEGPPARRSRRTALIVILALVVIGAAVGGWLIGTRRNGNDKRLAVQPQVTSVASTTVVPSTLAPTTAVPPPTTVAFEPLNSGSRAGANGVGGVLVGMTIDQAEHAAGMPISYAQNYGNAQCAYADPVGGPAGLKFMVSQGRIVRYDVESEPIMTFSGVGIGSSESAVLQAYGAQVTIKPHPYNSNGHYLEYTPRSSSLSAYRVIFETDGYQVTSYRGGYTGPVEAIEGCE